MGFRQLISNHNSDHTSENDDPSVEPLWTVEDVANYLRLDADTVRAMARDGKLPAIKFGRVWRFRRSAIVELFNE